MCDRVVLRLARSVLGDHDVSSVLKRVLESAQELTGARYAALGVLDSSSRRRAGRRQATLARPAVCELGLAALARPSSAVRVATSARRRRRSCRRAGVQAAGPPSTRHPNSIRTSSLWPLGPVAAGAVTGSSPSSDEAVVGPRPPSVGGRAVGQAREHQRPRPARGRSRARRGRGSVEVAYDRLAGSRGRSSRRAATVRSSRR